MPFVASELVWECVKNKNAFIRTSRNCPKMSAEPGNLMGLHMATYSGIANAKSLDVKSEIDGQKGSIVLVTKGKKTQKPNNMFNSMGVSKCIKKGAEALDKNIDSKFYRRDLLNLAKNKYKKVRASYKKNKNIMMPKKAKASSAE
mmetsp:Transcript_58005/g.115030  ORF Transcript_58005/g.115030 Transcript_58005/m.115030 type:complete len:145 (+) Transcript_58005:89-523(+)